MNDAIIIGAGPAGLSAALKLSQNGFSPIVIEKKTKIGTPVRCAELVRNDTFNLLSINPDKSIIQKKFKGSTLLYRDLWEISLAEKAIRQGAKIITGECAKNIVKDLRNSFSVVTNSGTYNTKVVVIAEGIESRISQKLNLVNNLTPETVISCFGARLSGVDTDKINDIEIMFHEKVSPFYGWIFPGKPGQANAGVGLLGKKGNLAYDYFNEFIKSYAGLKESKIDMKVAGIAPSSMPEKKPYDDGILICGSAARLTNPYTGEGIYHAVQSGIFAAETIIKSKGDYRASSLKYYNILIDDLRKYLTGQFRKRIAQTKI